MALLWSFVSKITNPKHQITTSEILKIGYFSPSENVHQLTPVSGVRETAKCSFMDKLPWIFIPRLLILWHKP
ncbi:MAG: hypothetical protein DRH24_13220 [Deltaproteobacteria bacterium]|nr:MAG: hypothetical protein DRH24_13220 [Deltaproteobacteria bacterium]